MLSNFLKDIAVSVIVKIVIDTFKFIKERIFQYKKDKEAYCNCLIVIKRSMNAEYLSKQHISAYGLCKFRLDVFETVYERLNKLGYKKEAQYFDSFIGQIKNGNKAIALSANQLIPMMRNLNR